MAKENLIEISEKNEKDYPFDIKRDYPIVDKTKDISVIEYDKEKNLYGVVFSTADQLTHVGTREACLDEMPIMQKGWDEHQEEEAISQSRFVDPTDLQPVDMDHLEWKQDQAELLGISLEEFNKREEIFEGLGKAGIKHDQEGNKLNMLEDKKENIVAYASVYKDGRVGIDIYEKQGDSFARIAKSEGFKNELNALKGVRLEESDMSVLTGYSGERFELITDIRKWDESQIKILTSAMDKFGVDYKDTPIEEIAFEIKDRKKWAEEALLQKDWETHQNDNGGYSEQDNLRDIKRAESKGVENKDIMEFVLVTKDSFNDVSTIRSDDYSEICKLHDERIGVELNKTPHELYSVSSKHLVDIKPENFVCDIPENSYNEWVYEIAKEKGKLMAKDFEVHLKSGVDEVLNKNQVGSGVNGKEEENYLIAKDDSPLSVRITHENDCSNSKIYWKGDSNYPTEEYAKNVRELHTERFKENIYQLVDKSASGEFLVKRLEGENIYKVNPDNFRQLGKDEKEYLDSIQSNKSSLNKSSNIPFSKNDEGQYVLKSIDEKEFEKLQKTQGFDNKMVYREHVDAVGGTNFILSQEGETFSKKNGIYPTPLGQFDYSEKELNEKKSLFENKNNNQQEVNTQKPNVMDTEKKEHKDQVIGFANKHNWSETDPTNKTYYLESVSQKRILEQKGDDYGSVRLGIKKVDREVANEGQVQKGSSYRVILYPRKDDPNVEAIISVKKDEIAKLKGEGEYKNTDLLVTNRDPLKASKDDLAVSNNPLEKGMTPVEQKKAMENRQYVGTGWTQKPELYALDKSQINTDELKKSIAENQSVKSQAIVLQGGKGLVTKEVVDTMKEAKEKHGEKFRPEIEKLVTDNFKEVKAKTKDKGMKV